jgi:hypothetical protein
MPSVGDVEGVWRETLEEDYAKGFAPRFGWSSRVRKSAVPFHAVDELRNGLDHFARAVLLESAAKTGASPPSIGDEPLSGDPMLDAARGRRHIVAAEYFCLYYIATWRLDDINAMLVSPLLQALTDPVAEFDERDACIDALADVDQPNTTVGARKAQEVNSEIDRTIELIEQLSGVTIRINTLWRRLFAQSRTVGLR